MTSVELDNDSGEDYYVKDDFTHSKAEEQTYREEMKHIEESDLDRM